MAQAARHSGSDRRAVAIIGDGAMTAGMAFEALNHAAHCRANMLVILNVNQMSISHNIGGLKSYFARIWASPPYNSLKADSNEVLTRIPPALDFARRVQEHIKGKEAPGMQTEQL